MAFSNPPDPKGYAERVYEIVRMIPSGRVMTYGQIGLLIPPPARVEPEQYVKLAPRWVGSAMANCGDDVPWQRVINSQGKVSARPGYGPMVQKHLLEQEGVTFDEKERVDLAQYRWEPEAAWLREHGFLPPEEPNEQPKLF